MMRSGYSMTSNSKQLEPDIERIVHQNFSGSIQFNSENLNHPTRGNFVVVMSGS